MRNPHTRECKAPKVLGKPERCGRPFPARGNAKTCSPGGIRKLRLEAKRRHNQKKAAKRPKLICATPECGAEFEAYKSSKFCPKHRRNYYQPHHRQKRNIKALEVYWKDPKKARAKNSAKLRAQLAKNPEHVRAKKLRYYHTSVANNPEKIRGQQHASYRRRFLKDPKKVRADGLANYYRHADKIKEKDRTEYWADPVLSRAKQRVKQKSKKSGTRGESKP